MERERAQRKKNSISKYYLTPKFKRPNDLRSNRASEVEEKYLGDKAQNDSKGGVVEGRQGTTREDRGEVRREKG